METKRQVRYRLGMALASIALLLSACGGGGAGENRPTIPLMGGAVQDGSLALGGQVTTIAGIAHSRDGVGPLGNFNQAQHAVWVADAGGGSVYITDSDAHVVRRFNPNTGESTTIAGTAGIFANVDGIGAAARFYLPRGIATDGTSLYVTSQNAIRRIQISTGQVTTIAGVWNASGTSDGTGAAARFRSPEGLATDGTYLYVSDSQNHTIRRVVLATGVVTTIAGTPGLSGNTDNPDPLLARFRSPAGLAVNADYLYVADWLNHGIRRISLATGAVTTLTSAGTLFLPRAVVVEGSTVYVTSSGDHRIRAVAIGSGSVSTIAGMTGLAGSDDGTGPIAKFNRPIGLASNGTDLFVVDSWNYTLRQLNIATATVSTVASIQAGHDGAGQAARFASIAQMTTDGIHIYIADSLHHVIRRIRIDGAEVTTIAGSTGNSGSSDGTGSSARFESPSGITTDGHDLFVSEENNHTIRRISLATGEVSTLAGQAGTGGSDDGPGVDARFSVPRAITTDGSHLYVADTFNHTIRRINLSTGTVDTLAGSAGVAGNADGTGPAAQFQYPTALVADGHNLYIADDQCRIRKIALASAEVTTLAGSGLCISADGVGFAASFGYPKGITSDGHNLFVADSASHVIRRIAPASGMLADMTSANAVVTTLAGSLANPGEVDGIGPASRFWGPMGITAGRQTLYVGDQEGGTIRAIQ